MNKLKKWLLAITLVVIGGVAVNNVYLSPKIRGMSYIMLANVEALAQDENIFNTGTCGSYGWTGDSYMIVCKASKEEAMENFNWWNTPNKGWCCDSCPGTWYCGGA